MSSEYLCAGCPGKDNARVDFDVTGSCPYYAADSFRQTRRYRIQQSDDYGSNEEMAEMSARFLRYYDEETDDFYEREGDLDAARIGIACAERVLAGLCPKNVDQVIIESEID